MTAKGSLEYGGLNCPGATTLATELDSVRAARARRSVASAALGAEDCALLLEMLGLVPEGMTLTQDVP